jgi:hypothetical protein
MRFRDFLCESESAPTESDAAKNKYIPAADAGITIDSGLAEGNAAPLPIVLGDDVAALPRFLFVTSQHRRK